MWIGTACSCLPVHRNDAPLCIYTTTDGGGPCFPLTLFSGVFAKSKLCHAFLILKMIFFSH